MLTRRTALTLVAGFVFAPPASPDDTLKTKVEFRRAETTAAEGLTEATVSGTKDKVYLHKTADLTAEDVASVVVTGEAKNPGVEVTFTEAGAKKAATISAAHLDKPVAVVVDGKVISAPVVKAKFGRSILITGRFTAEEAKALAKAIGGK